MTEQETTSTNAKRRRAAKEAASWLARLELGSAEPAAFEAWRSHDVAHEIAFARVLGAASAVETAPTKLRQVAGLSRRGLVRAACGVAATAAVGFGGFSAHAYAWSTASSGVGQRRTVHLPDGSSAKLNTNSCLAWRFHRDIRELRIKRGEVALDLRPGPHCVLSGPTKRVTLSAGRYDARLRGTAVDLLIMTGRAVHAGTNGETLAAEAGQGLLMPLGDSLVRPATPDELAAVLAWQQGEILFQHETLGSAVEEYNRYLTRKIVIADRDLANIPVGGRFTSDDPKAFLRSLSLSLGVRVSASESGFLITR